MKQLFYKFEQYLITEKMVAVNTLKAYQRDIIQCINFLESRGRNSFDQVIAQDIKDFLHHLRLTLKISARTASRKLSSLKSFSKFIQYHYDQPDFTYQVSFPKLEKSLPKFLTQDQVLHLFSVAQSDTSLAGQRNYVMISLMYVCGVRVSELIELTSSNINFSDGLLHVTGKGGKQRIVPLPESMVAMLQAYLLNVQPYLFKNMTITSDILFPILYADQVKPMTRQGFWGILKHIVIQSGLPETISPHVLRHSIATHLLKKGANLRLLQMALGHEQLQTVQVYTHVEVSHLRALYNEKHPRA